MYSIDFRNEVLSYYADHTAEECRERFRVDKFSVYGWAKSSGIVKHHKIKGWPDYSRENNPAWKGGRTRRTENSIRVLIGKKEYRDEHVLIAEKVLGRKLKAGEVIHHIDFNTRNNRNDNLLICTKSFHVWLHRKLDYKNGINHLKGMKSPYQKAA
jgi:hypothetical protein